MTERDMKWALELAVRALNDMASHHCQAWSIETYRQAAEMIRTGGSIVKKQCIEACFKCECGALYNNRSCCPKCGLPKYHAEIIPSKKEWEEQEVLKISLKKSRPTHTEVEPC